MRKRSIVGWTVRVLGLAVLVGGQLVLTATGASGDTFNVTNGNDSGAGSLRQAFADASATAGDDIIVVDDAVGTITLTTEVQHLPGDNAAVALQGNDVTIQQTGANSRVIGNGSNGALTIDGATLTGGNGTPVQADGGGIGSFGPVTLTNSIVTGNATTSGNGGGIAASDVTLTNSTVANNTAALGGGGIAASSDVTLTNSTVSNNTAGFSGGGITAGGAVTLNDNSAVSDNTASNGNGGGIFSNSAVTLTSSTVSGNDATVTALGVAGGVDAVGIITATDSTISGNSATANGDPGAAAGGLGSSGSNITLVRSTVSDNTATAPDGGALGGVGTFADVSATNSTVTGNDATASDLAAGGIGANDVTLTHATVVGNSGANAGNVAAFNSNDTSSLTTFGSVLTNPASPNCAMGSGGTTTSTGYNFADDMTCGLINPTDNQNLGNDPMLGALANNGGPTQTRAPQSGSPLINAIPTGDCDPTVTTDQRGVARPQGAGCEIGSVEVAPPGAPTNVTATAGDSQATVAWVAPADDGGSPVTGYTVTADPGGQTCAWSSGPLSCTVGGLANGTDYSFSVTAENAAGVGAVSVASNVVTPLGWAGHLHPVVPARILDTRDGTGFVAARRVNPGETVELQVTGEGPVPAAGVAAVLLNVTVTAPTGPGFLTIYPSGDDQPLAANLNFVAGQTIPNLVTAKVGADGKVAIFNHTTAAVHVIADVNGWFSDETVPDGARLQPVVPARILDTRDGTGFVAARRVNPGETVAVQVAGEGGVPTEGVEGVVLNVTVTDPTGPGFLTVYPSGEDQPLAANLNFVAGQTIPNLVTAKVGDDGKVAIFNHTTAAVHVIADVNGWYSNTGVQGGARLEPLVPERILDTRDGTGFVAARRVNPGETVALQITGEGGVPPDGVAAVVLNVTVTAPTGPGFLTVYPSGEDQPLAANLNFVAGQTIPNLVVAKIGTDGKVAIFNHTTAAVHVIADVNGYYNTPGP